MDSYAGWFEGKPELDILHIIGLFDRPVDEGALQALLVKRATKGLKGVLGALLFGTGIRGLTSKLTKLSREDWQNALANLRRARLLAGPDPNAPNDLDAHPLVREHFGDRLQKANHAAWKEAHSSLYEHYKTQAPELPETLEQMAPLFAAVAHGCHAGRHQQAYTEVYQTRISRRNEFFTTRRLGAFGSDLAALSGFFDPPWRRPVAELTEATRSFVLGQAGFRLRALGRLAEAIQPLRAGLDSDIVLEDWTNAAISAGNLCELHQSIGDLARALDYARQSVELADKSGDSFLRMAMRATLAAVLHHAGRLEEAEALFREVEEMQKERQPEFSFLYSLRGYNYCDLLLGQAKYEEVQHRAGQTLGWVTKQGPLLDIALDHLSLGRAYLLHAQQERTGDLSEAEKHLDRAVHGLRVSGQQDELPRGLLVRAELNRSPTGFQRARSDLDEAMSIAERGGMRLHEADAHLEYTRLHLAMGDTEKARESLDTAKAMVEEMGYHRRDPDVADLESQLANG